MASGMVYAGSRDGKPLEDACSSDTPLECGHIYGGKRLVLCCPQGYPYTTCDNSGMFETLWCKCWDNYEEAGKTSLTSDVDEFKGRVGTCR